MAHEFYKGQTKCLCPYYVNEKKLYIICNHERFFFDDPDEKIFYRNHNCLFAVPRKCPRWLKHWENIKAGKEEKLPPKAMFDWSETIRKREGWRKWNEKQKQKKENPG